MNDIRKFTRPVAALLGLILLTVLVGITLSLGRAQGPGEPFPVNDISPGSNSSVPGWLTAVDGAFFFESNDDTHGGELWKSDGTAAGAVQVKDVNPGSGDSYPEYLTAVDGALFFQANDTTHGQELWAISLTAEVITVHAIGRRMLL